MVTYSPTDEWFNPKLWEFWAMLLTAMILAVMGYWAALKEDQNRRIRGQRRRSRPSSKPKPISRQRSISYSAERWQSPVNQNQPQNRPSQSKGNTG